MTSNEGNLMDREFEGMWWTPENDSLKIPSNLTFDRDQGGMLILQNGLLGASTLTKYLTKGCNARLLSGR